ncbi:MAG: ribonuclease R [Nitrospirae bacterium]|nr:ribonuclease R [Nitrospirota bacterium]
MRKIRKKVKELKKDLAGKLQTHHDGYGFVLSVVPGEPDVYVPRTGMSDAMHGDQVLTRITGFRRGKPEGRIIKVLQRSHKQVVGKYTQISGVGWVVPNDRKMTRDVHIPLLEELRPEPGEMVVAEITSYPTLEKGPEGRIIKILGEAYTPLLDTSMVMEEFHLPAVFPPAILEESEKVPTGISEEMLAGRRDLRREVTLTIDGEHAKDFDDAVSAERLGSNQIRLGVHIADVGAYVPWKSPLDREAYERGTSVYFPDKVVPMFPEALSNGICSLNPHVDRLTYSVDMIFDEEGNRIDYKIYESVIKSQARMTYTEVRDIINSPGRSSLRKKEVLDTIFLLEELALKLKKKRFVRGSIDFDLPEPQILIDVAGEITSILKEERNFAHKIIEECMLAANETVAEHMANLDLPFIYRIHDKPTPEKIQDFNLFVSNLGYSLKGFPKKVTPKSFQDILDQIKGKVEERVVNHLMLRSMKQAVYSTDNPGHFGLAAEFYTHFTSPIRRYPDLMVHRLLKMASKGELTPNKIPIYKKSLPEMTTHCSARERVSVDAEREVISLKKVRFMDNKIDEEFDGHISGVTSFGLFIELNDIFVEGLVHISTLEDHYHFDTQKHSLIGARFRNVYRLGDPVRVLVERVSLEKREVSFKLLNEIPEKKPAGEPKPAGTPAKKSDNRRKFKKRSYRPR